MATADQIYADPSALVCLYVHQEGRSRRMVAWRASVAGGLPVTHHGRTEVINAICRAHFTGELDDDGVAEATADFEADFFQGRLTQADILWRAATS